jgi:hypothetical protein
VRANPERKLKLLLAGVSRGNEGPLMTTFAAELGVRDRVMFLGVNAEDRPLLYSAADILVSPVDSVQESFGLVPVEAMACGLPQVVSDWDGYRDTVLDGETGILVPTSWARCDEDAADWAEVMREADLIDHFALGQSVAVDLGAFRLALQKLIDSPELRARMSSRSRAVAVERYAWPRVVAQYEALLGELSAIAARTNWMRTPPDHERPRFHLGFGHYATRNLDDSARVRATTAGVEVREGKKQLPVLRPEWAVLYPDVAMAALRLVVLSSGESTIGAIVAAVGAQIGAPAHRVRRHVLWLLKYGLLELATPKAD